MTNQEEEEAMHHVLATLVLAPGHAADATPLFEQKGVVMFRKAILDRLVSENLVRQVMPTHGYYVVEITTHGIQIARHPGGYKGHLAAIAQQQQQQVQAQREKDALERDVAQATVASAKSSASSARAAWVAAVISAVSIALSIYAIHQSNELDAVKSQLNALQRQVKSLTKQAQ